MGAEIKSIRQGETITVGCLLTINEDVSNNTS